MQTSMNVKTAKLLQLQELVKKHNFRFKGNPIVMGDTSRVWIDGDHLTMPACNAFFIDWERMNTPIVEKKSSYLNLLKRRINRAFSAIAMRMSRTTH